MTETDDEPVGFPEACQFIRLLREWIKLNPDKPRWTLTRHQVDMVLCVIGVLSGDDN